MKLNMETKKVFTDPTLVKHLHGHQKCVTGLGFDPQSKQLVSSSHDHSLILWNLKEKMRAFKFLGHTDVVSDACFSPNGQLIASSSFDRNVRLWTPTIGGNSAVFRAHTKAVQSVHFSHDGLTLLTSSNDRSIKEWSVSRKTFLSTFTGHTNWVKSARFSHDSKIVVSAANDKNVKLFDRQSHQCIHTFIESRVPQKAIFHPCDTYVAAALSNKCIKLYDLRVLKQLQLYQCHEDDVTNVEFHPDGNYLFSSSSDGTTKIIDLLEGRTLYTLEGNRGPLTAVVSSCSGEYFATGGLDGQILLWKANFDEILCGEDESESNESTLDKDLHKLKNSVIKEKFHNIEMSNCEEDKENVQLNVKSLNSRKDLNGLESRHGENVSTLDKDLHKLKNSVIKEKFRNIEMSNCEEDKENVKLNVKSLNPKEYINGLESWHVEDSKSLSKKMDAVLEILYKMKDELAFLDERCKKLEDMHLNLI